MEKQEFTVTGPGEYRTRDGRKAVVSRINNGGTWPARGTIEGQPDAECWRLNGGWEISEGAESPTDIVGPWVEPATLDAVRAGVDAEVAASVAGAVETFTPPEFVEVAERVPTPEPEPERSAFALGQTWRTRGGDVVEIVSVSDPGEQPIKGINKDIGAQFWNADGAYMRGGAASSMDLVELVSAPDEMIDAEAAVRAWHSNPENPALRDAALERSEAARASTVDVALTDSTSVPVEAGAVEVVGEWPRFTAHAPAFGAYLANAADAGMESLLLVANPDAEEEPTDYRECAEVLAAALRMLCDAVDASIPRGAHGLKLEDARRLATIALDGYAP